MKADRLDSHKHLCQKLGLKEEKEIRVVAAVLEGELKREHVPQLINYYDPSLASQELQLMTAEELGLELKELRMKATEECLLLVARTLRALHLKIEQHRKKGVNASQLSVSLIEKSTIIESQIFENQELSKENQDTYKINRLIKQNRTLTQRVQALETTLQSMESSRDNSQAMEDLEIKLKKERQCIKGLKMKMQEMEEVFGKRIKVLQGERDGLMADCSRLEKENSKTVQQRENLISKNVDSRTVIRHLQKKYKFSQTSNDNLKETLKKLEKGKNTFGHQEKEEYILGMEEMLRRQELSISNLNDQVVAKEEEIMELKQKWELHYQHLISQQEEKVAHLREEMERENKQHLQRELRSYKETQLSPTLIQLESILDDLHTKQKAVKNLKQENQNLVRKNQECKQQLEQLKTIIGWREKNKQYQEQFRYNVQQIQTYLKLMLESRQNYREQSRLRSPLFSQPDQNQPLTTPTTYQEEVQRLQDELAQQKNLEERLAFAEGLIETAEDEKEKLEMELKQMNEYCCEKQKEYFREQQKVMELEKQLSRKRSTIFTVSPILEGQEPKMSQLTSFIQTFTQQTILKSELKFKYDELNNNFGFYLTQTTKDFPFVVLFRLQNSQRIMGVFSSGLFLGPHSQNPEAFVFGLEGQGCMFGKRMKNSYSPTARLQDNALILGNGEVVIRNQSQAKQFQIATSIMGNQYFMISNLLDLTGEYSSGSFTFQEMELHRIWF